MVNANHEFGSMTEKLACQLSLSPTAKNCGEHSRWKYMKRPTDSSLIFPPNLRGTREKVKTKLANETRRQHTRRLQLATFSRRREIWSEQSILIDFPQVWITKLKLLKFLIDFIDREG